MSTVVIRRAPRRPAPEIPTGELVVEAPPEIPQASGGRWQQMLTVLPMLGGAGAMAMMMGQGRPGAYAYVAGGLMGVSALGMLASQLGSSNSPKKAEMMAARREYVRHLAGLRRRVRDSAGRQRAGLYYRHPDPAQLWSTVGSHRLWERRPSDPDFAVVRVAVGPQTLATPLVPPVTRPLEELEPMTAAALRRFLDAYSVVPDLPVALSLRGFARVFLRGPDGAGPDSDTRGLIRAILTQLATFHAPDNLLIAIAAGPQQREMWEWAKWLPHAQHPTKTDALGSVRLVAGCGTELEKMLEDVIGNRPRFVPGGGGSGEPHVVIVLDGVNLRGATQLDDGLDGVTVLDLDEKPPRLLDRSLLVLDIKQGQGRKELHTYAMEHAAEVGTPDRLGITEAEGVARRLAPLRLAAMSTTAGDGPVATYMDLPELLGFSDPETYSVQQLWAPRPNRDKLRVPIGVGVDGVPVELDLKESAQDGMGPHGLLIGATGSGKSELLRTLVLALAMTHSSETLNFVLIDFKGGATFASLDRMPHTAAIITNLSDELPLADRMVEAINGELLRRQTLLRKAGNYASLRDYEKARAAGGTNMAPLPSLLLICDEFSELLTAKPDFIDLFVQIGRVGRSLGVHLLLASQRLEEGRLRGLDTHLSYRVGLRTFSALESRAVLGVPDAFELPREPGHGYLKFGTEPLNRFKAAYVSGPHVTAANTAAGTVDPADVKVQSYSTHYVPVVEQVKKAAPKKEAAGGRSLLDIVVDRMIGQGPPAHQVWLPPLVNSSALDELLGAVTVDPQRGLVVGNPELHGALQVPLALVDKPAEQRRDVLWLQFAGAAGHLAVVGGPQSGKSTALRTMICGLTLTHTPHEVQVYCLDFGGGGLGGVRDLPHVGSVAARLDAAAVRRTASEVHGLLAERELRFAEQGVESMASYRRRRKAAIELGDLPDDPYGDVFLVIDGWQTLRKEYEDLEMIITDIATRGLSYGIHVVAGASRWMDFRPNIRDLFGSKIELRLGDPTDSIAPRKISMNVPEGTPGRGIVGENKDFMHLLTIRPELTNVPETSELARLSASSWSGPTAPRIRLLPAALPYRAMDFDRSTGLRIPIGLSETDMDQVELDFHSEPHFLLFGDAECGKSTFLRQLAATISQRFTPEQARMIVVDYRRSLFDTDTPHRIGHGTTAQHTLELMHSVAGYMQKRLPGPDLTAQQLRDRSWWTGAELFVLVDDYDLVNSGPSNPLQPLLEYLPQARDIGLHLVLTRRAGGASRASFEPVIQRLRELSSPGLVMSGDPGEGALIGPVKPGPLPPGRGRLWTRKEGVRLVQVANLPPG